MNDAPIWFVCHTKPRCEKKFVALLEAEHFENYLPLMTSVRTYARETKRYQKPLFPGYVFTRILGTDKPRLFQQELLVSTINVENQPLFESQLNQVRLLVASGIDAVLHPLLRVGRRVKVVAGPLKGVEGMIDDPDNPKGIVVAVDVLGQGVRVPLPACDLKPID